MSSEPKNPPDDVPASERDQKREEPTPQAKEEKPKDGPEAPKILEPVAPEPKPEEEKKESLESSKKSVEPMPDGKGVEPTAEGEKKSESKTLEERKRIEPTPDEERKIESKSFEARRRESKAEMTARTSVKSLQSLGMRPSKESGKDYFGRKKSQRSIRGALGSIISFRRGSIAEYYDRQRAAKFMNTYKLDSEKPFNVDRVTKILEEVLIEALDNLTYDAEKVPKQAKWASSAIRAKVKEQEYDRYKILCIVTMGEKRSQDVYSMYRFLWDADRDKHASFVHENMSVFAIAMCFGLYYE